MRTWDAVTGKPGAKIPVADIPPGAGDAKQKIAWPSPNGKYMVAARGALTPVLHQEVPFRVFATDKTGKTLVDAKWVGGTVHFTADSSRLLVAEHSGRFRWFSLAEESEPQGWDYPPAAAGQTHTVTAITASGRVIGYNGPARSRTETGPCLVDGKTGDVLHRFGKGVRRALARRTVGRRSRRGGAEGNGGTGCDH